MNKKINQLSTRTAVGTDLALVGDPTTGTSYKTTFAELPLVPYTGATGAVTLGLYGLTAGTLTLQEQTLNSSTYKLTQRMASNDYWSIYGFSTVADYGDLYFELQDNAAFADGQRFRFHYGNASSGTPKDILLMDYNTATFDGAVQVNDLAGTGTRMVVTDTNGALSTQAIPSLSSGGSSISYYLNGGTAASVGAYFQMSQTAVIGTNADFTRTGNGLISQFLTDVGDPNRLQIPAGNWNFEMYFSISSSGGNTAFYVELLKYNGTTFTSIASSSVIPEEITGGTNIDLYLTSLAIPATTLLVTDRLALRVYIVNNSGGRTVTLHTQDSHLCQIITNFAGGVSALNGLTANTQYFATGTSGTNFAIVSSGDTHTFNLPTASGTNRGALSSADWTTFNSKQATLTLTTTGTSGAATLVGATLNIPQYSGGGGGSMAIGGAITSATAGSVLFAGTSGVLQQDNANLFWDDTNNRLGIGTATPTRALDVASDIVINGVRIGRGFGNESTSLALGYLALNSQTTGYQNTAISYEALKANTTGINNVAIGVQSLLSNTTGQDNFGLGFNSLGLNTTGSFNVAVGSESMRTNVGGRYNVALGFYALYGSKTDYNIGIGDNTLRSQTTGLRNVAIGAGTLYYNTTGSYNTICGFGAMQNSTSAAQNTGLGYEVFFGNLTGNNNSALGYRAGRYISGGATSNTITNNSIYIGYQTKALADNQTNQIVIGYDETGLGSNTTIIGNSSTITTALRGRLILGTTTDSGSYQLDVNGTARVSGKLSITAGTTAASQINLASSTAPTSPNNGDIWFDGTNLLMRIGGVTKTFTLV